MNGKKEVKLVNKVKRLVRRLGFPRFLNKYGPKKYELYVYLACLLIRSYSNLSYRRTVNILNLLDFRCPSKSSLQNMMKRIPSYLWNKALEVTSGSNHYIIAIDSTGLSRTNPSYYYLRRIDGKLPRKHIKLSSSYDTRRKKFCNGKVRIIPRHDIKDIKYLIRNVNTKIIVADKGYDSEDVHEYCYLNNIEAHIPLRNYGKRRHKNLGYRIRASKLFRNRTYHRRELIECGFSSIKRKYGGCIRSKISKTIKADVLSRLLCHNFIGYYR
mgnify:FL=1